MNSTLKISSISFPFSSSLSFSHRNSRYTPKSRQLLFNVIASSDNGAVSPQDASRAVGDAHRRRSGLESLFCYDKAIPEEIIEKPTGLSLAEKNIGDNIRCSECQAKGVVLCPTCSGSGLYLDSIMESQGIMVKIRCLGCGGTGNTMCSDCGGRGHVGVI